MQINVLARRKQVLGSLALGGLLAGLAWAGNALAAPAMPFEIGAEAGWAKQEYSLDEPIGDQSGDEFAYRLYGTWYPLESVGVRAGYAGFTAAEVYRFEVGPARYVVESDVSAFTLGGVLSTPINQGPVTLWGEAGLAFWDVDLDQKLEVPGLVVGFTDEVASDSGAAPYLGVGANLKLGSRFGLGLSAFWYKLEPEYMDQDVDLDIRVLSAGASFRF